LSHGFRRLHLHLCEGLSSGGLPGLRCCQSYARALRLDSPSSLHRGFDGFGGLTLRLFLPSSLFRLRRRERSSAFRRRPRGLCLNSPLPLRRSLRGLEHFAFSSVANLYSSLQQ
jgi:hypothetical protein